MAEKPKIIKRLENKIGIELKKIELKYIGGSPNGYTSDERENIIGLNLFHAVSDISFLKEFLHLTHLEVSGNQITDVSPLMYLKNLRRLNLTHNHISQLPPEFLHLDLEIKWKYNFGDGFILMICKNIGTLISSLYRNFHFVFMFHGFEYVIEI